MPSGTVPRSAETIPRCWAVQSLYILPVVQKNNTHRSAFCSLRLQSNSPPFYILHWTFHISLETLDRCRLLVHPPRNAPANEDHYRKVDPAVGCGNRGVGVDHHPHKRNRH